VEVILFYLIFCIVVSFIASQRGRSGFGWFLLSLLISPVLAVIIVALIPSLSPSAISLESQVRDRLLEDRFAQSIRPYKPAFSNSLVYYVEIGGEKRRFRSKADAIAFCMSRVNPDAPQLPNQL
jgi:uncharacterized membrane protein YhdT